MVSLSIYSYFSLNILVVEFQSTSLMVEKILMGYTSRRSRARRNNRKSRRKIPKFSRLRDDKSVDMLRSARSKESSEAKIRGSMPPLSEGLQLNRTTLSHEKDDNESDSKSIMGGQRPPRKEDNSSPTLRRINDTLDMALAVRKRITTNGVAGEDYRVSNSKFAGEGPQRGDVNSTGEGGEEDGSPGNGEEGVGEGDVAVSEFIGVTESPEKEDPGEGKEKILGRGEQGGSGRVFEEEELESSENGDG